MPEHAEKTLAIGSRIGCVSRCTRLASQAPDSLFYRERSRRALCHSCPHGARFLQRRYARVSQRLVVGCVGQAGRWGRLDPSSQAPPGPRPLCAGDTCVLCARTPRVSPLSRLVGPPPSLTGVPGKCARTLGGDSVVAKCPGQALQADGPADVAWRPRKCPRVQGSAWVGDAVLTVP